MTDSRRSARAARVAVAGFVVAVLAGAGLIAVYASGGQTQAEGVLLALGFVGVGVGLAVWARVLLDEPPLTEARHPMGSSSEDRTAIAEVVSEGPDDPARRRTLVRLLGAAGVSLGLALILPFRSLGPGREGALKHTAWRRGSRLVTADGSPVRADTLDRGGVLTVFPENALGSADSQAVLIAVDPARLVLPAGAPETVDGLVCYSKVCTHAGCPVGLYREPEGELLCPCHQSTFDVYVGAVPTSGPAARPLPQLPLGVGDDGVLIALGDFPEPIGPSFWDVHR